MNVINSFSVGKDFIEIFVDKATSGGSCTVLTTTVQPGGGPPLHQHSREDETFRVLEGQFDFLVDGVTHTVKTGEIFFAPRGTVHTFKNNQTTPSKILNFVAPGGFEVFLERLSKLSPPTQMPQILALGEEFGIKFFPPPAES